MYWLFDRNMCMTCAVGAHKSEGLNVGIDRLSQLHYVMRIDRSVHTYG